MSLFHSFSFARPTQSSQRLPTQSFCFESLLRKYNQPPKINKADKTHNSNNLQGDFEGKKGSNQFPSSENAFGNTMIDMKKKIKIARKRSTCDFDNIEDKENFRINGNELKQKDENGSIIEKNVFREPIISEEKDFLNIEELLRRNESINDRQVEFESSKEFQIDQFLNDEEPWLNYVEPIKRLSKTDSSGLVLQQKSSFPVYEAEQKNEAGEVLLNIEDMHEEKRVVENSEKKESEVHIKTKLSLRLLKRKLEKKSIEQVAKEIVSRRKVEIEGKIGQNEKNEVYEALVSFIKHQLVN